MFQTKSIIQEKNSNNPYLFVNLVFGFFPISFILGSLIVNVNLLLFCCLGIFYLRTKILTIKFDLPIKIIFLFFFIIFFSTILGLIRSFYFNDYDSINLSKLVKSALFFRFFLFLTIVYLLSNFNILRFKYFFLVAAFSSVLLSLDVIYQHFFGVDILGLKSEKFRSSGFFGDEAVAGGYLLRFGFFTIFFTILALKNKNYIKFISTVIVICILGTGIFLTTNRIPFILFLFGLFLILLFNFKIKKILLTSFLALFILLQFIISSDEKFKTFLVTQYSSFYHNAINISFLQFHHEKPDIWARSKRTDVEWFHGGERTIDKAKSIGQKTTFHNVQRQPIQYKLFLASLYTWKSHKIFGNGIKSFYPDCHKLDGSEINIAEDEDPDKINLSCSNHPHNYYFQILTTTGIVGLFIIFVIGLLFIIFTFKNFKFIKKFDTANIILFSAIISFFLETFPIRTTGSLYTTNNATYIILIGSIILSYKELLKAK